MFGGLHREKRNSSATQRLKLTLNQVSQSKKYVSSLRPPFRPHAARLSTPPFPKRAAGGVRP